MVHIETSEYGMVRIASAAPGRDYELYDVGGRHLGRVVEPEGPPRLGPGAATVLLCRAPGDSPQATG